MKAVDTGNERVKKICDVLRRETLEPARKEADEILQGAVEQANSILEEAKEQASKMKKEALEEIEKQKNVFQSSLNQACKQSLELLRENIEQKLFSQELSNILKQPLQESKVLVDLIQAVVHALEKEGIDADLDVCIPRSVSAREINSLLFQRIVERLRGGSVSVGLAQGGIEVKVFKDNMIIDLTDEALKNLVSRYIRKDFQEILFRTN